MGPSVSACWESAGEGPPETSPAEGPGATGIQTGVQPQAQAGITFQGSQAQSLPTVLPVRVQTHSPPSEGCTATLNIPALQSLIRPHPPVSLQGPQIEPRCLYPFLLGPGVRGSTSCLLPLAGPLQTMGRALLAGTAKQFLTLLLISLWNLLAPVPHPEVSGCTARPQD